MENNYKNFKKIMDDDLDPKEIEDIDEEDLDSDIDDILAPGKKKAKKLVDEEESADDLAEEEDAILPEDLFDDHDEY